jgi:hypothetical protein
MSTVLPSPTVVLRSICIQFTYILLYMIAGTENLLLYKNSFHKLPSDKLEKVPSASLFWYFTLSLVFVSPYLSYSLESAAFFKVHAVSLRVLLLDFWTMFQSPVEGTTFSLILCSQHRRYFPRIVKYSTSTTRSCTIVFCTPTQL